MGWKSLMNNYKCEECGAEFEKTESCGCSCSEEKIKCPQCGSTNVKMVEDRSKSFGFMKNFKFSGG